MVFFHRSRAADWDNVVANAKVRLAICDAMAEAYQRRWRQPFYAVQNAVDLTAVSPGNPQRDPALPMRLGYIGSIFSYAQSQSLADIAQSVARLASGGRALTLDIFSPLHLAEPFRGSLEIHPAIRLHDTIADDAAFFAKLSELSAMVLPVNFDPVSVAYIRYSMPTKVPAYLASGTPILAYGPPDTAQIAYAAREGWGLVVGHRDPRLLDEAIAALQDDNALRARLSDRAREIASRHDVRHVRSLFQSLLSQAVDK
jgi:glycosyltransferase involved in cell wall biosynthesis